MVAWNIGRMVLGNLRSRFQGHAKPTTRLIFFGALVTATASACAAEVNTLEPGDEPLAGGGGAGMSVSGAGHQSTSGGATALTAAGMGGAGGTKVGYAFGGTASTGGSVANGGAAGAAGSSSSGGAAGSGGKAAGGGAGGLGGKGGSAGASNGGAAGQAGTSGSSGAGTSGSGGGGNLACLASWKNDVCDTCSKQTQSDKLACVEILDCYAANACGPATCGSNDAKCGANKIGKGTAGYPIAQDVYTCLCK